LYTIFVIILEIVFVFVHDFIFKGFASKVVNRTWDDLERVA
jgi:hypothetical protein